MTLGHLRWRWYRLTKHRWRRGQCVRCEDEQPREDILNADVRPRWCLKGKLAVGGGGLVILHLLCHEVPMILVLAVSVLKSAGWLAD